METSCLIMSCGAGKKSATGAGRNPVRIVTMAPAVTPWYLERRLRNTLSLTMTVMTAVMKFATAMLQKAYKGAWTKWQHWNSSTKESKKN
jgi:hypothetical protein